ncbi:MAG: ATP-binding protein [Candidatus Limnocylindrales bacterium]
MTGPPPGAPSGPTSVERRVVTVLFADLVGFTPLGERLDAEDVAAIQDAYFGAVRETIARHGGRLEKFIGDAAMAVFGLPRGRDDDAERAVRSGLALVGAVERLGAELGLAEDELRLRVGIESGEVVAAEGGPDEGRVTGDTVNTAARLQAAAPPGGVLLGEGAALAAATAIELEAQPPLALKGKAQPVRAALARSVRPEPSRAAAMGALRAPMVGREAEMAQLQEALDHARDGGSATCLVVAAPGTGKSRLVAEFLAGLDVPVSGLDVPVWTTRVRAGSGASLEPLAGLARAATGGQAAPATEARLRAAGVPAARSAVLAADIAALAGAVGASGSDAAGEREARHAAWIEALDGLTGGRPVVWVVEDVHWAGGDVLAFLDRATRAAAPFGRLVIATARPGILERLADWALEDGDVRRLVMELAPLPPTRAAELVDRLVGPVLPPDLEAEIARLSDGNPLFIEELLRTWVGVGRLVRDGEAWRLAGAPDAVRLPTTVQAIYGAQLDDLPPSERLLVRRASVAGRRFPTAALEPLAVPDAVRAVAGLHDRAILKGPLQDDAAGESWSYRHALLRDVGYASLGRAERARLHVRLARWLESVAGEGVDRLAEQIGGHYESALAAAPALAREVDDGLERAGAARLGADWLEKAAVAALGLSAVDATIDLLGRALALTEPSGGPDAARRELLLGETVAAAGDMEAGLGHARTARDGYLAAFRAADPGSKAWSSARDGYSRAAVALSRLVREQLRFEEARELAAAALTVVGGDDDVAGVRLQLAASMARYFVTDRAEDLLPAARKALAIARREGDAELELLALEQRTFDEDAPIEAFLAAWQELGQLAARAGRWEQASRALRTQGMVATDLSLDPHPFFDAAAEVALAHGLTEALAWTEYGRTEVDFGAGEWDRAWLSGLRALELAEDGSYHRIAVRTWHAIVPIAEARGRRDVLERALRWYVDHESFLPDSPYGRLLYRSMRLRFAAAGLIPPFEHDVDPLLASFEGDLSGATTLAAADTVVTAWLRDARLAAASEALARMEGPAHRTRFPDVLPAWQVLAARLLEAEGEGPVAVGLARSALPALRAYPMPPWTARAIRALEAAGAATEEELAEAAAIEARLRGAA